MKAKWGILVLISVLFSSCEEENYIPKPVAYHRLDFPVHAYQVYEDPNCPYTFEYGQSAKIVAVESESHSCWFNVVYPQMKSKVHFSYYPVSSSTVEQFMEDARKLALKHLVKADDFEESFLSDTNEKVYGTIYSFEGNAASNLQFYLTDSTQHFIRGALYFEVEPNADSLAPAEMYVEEEIMHLVSTFKWK